MPIYIGANELLDGKITIGGSAVTAVYVGAVQVWPPTPVGPGGPRWTEAGAERWTEDGQTRVTEDQ